MDTSHKLQIHELLGRYAHGMDTEDLEQVDACFADDASFTIRITNQDPIPPFKGKVAIMGLIKSAMDSQTDVRRHVCSNVFFESESNDEAVVISYLTLVSVENGNIKILTSGIYRDVVTLTNGKWCKQTSELSLDLPY